MTWVKFRFLVLLAVGGCLLAWNGQREMRLARQSLQEPRWVSCERLIADGVADNAHVRLNGFWCNPDNVVYHHRDSGGYVETYIPVHPEHGTPGTVLLRSTAAPDAEAVHRVLGKNAVKGTVVNAVSSLSGDVRTSLAHLVAPGQDPLIVDIGRKPKTPAAAMSMLIGGVMLSLPMVLALPGRLQRRAHSSLQDEAPLPAAPRGTAPAVESRPYF